jgi:hypothetical protein
MTSAGTPALHATLTQTITPLFVITLRDQGLDMYWAPPVAHPSVRLVVEGVVCVVLGVQVARKPVVCGGLSHAAVQ